MDKTLCEYCQLHVRGLEARWIRAIVGVFFDFEVSSQKLGWVCDERDVWKY